MARKIVITSGKGGVGKSTVCAALGERLSRMGRRVLLLETGRRCLDVLMGAADRVVFDLSDVLSGRAALSQAVLEIGRLGRLFLLCAPAFYAGPIDGASLAALLESAGDYDDILIDTPGDTALLAILAPFCDMALLVSAPEPVSARDTRVIRNLLESAGVGEIRLCINLLPADFLRARPAPDLDWVIDTVCAQLIAVIPKTRTASFAAGEDGVLRLPKPLLKAFDNLAQRIMGRYIDLWIQ